MQQNLTIKTLPANNPDVHVTHELWEGDDRLLSFSHNLQMRTARIEGDSFKRVVMLDKANNASNRFLLQNEYGIEIGELSYNKRNINEGYITVNKEQFTYNLKNSSEPEVEIINVSSLQNSVTIKGFSGSNRSIFPNKIVAIENYFGLMLSVCLFLLTPYVRDFQKTNVLTAVH